MSIIYSNASRVQQTLAQLRTHEDWFLSFQLFIVNQNKEKFPYKSNDFFSKFLETSRDMYAVM